MKCPNCGAPAVPEDRFCGECGTPLSPKQVNEPAKTKKAHTLDSESKISEPTPTISPKHTEPSSQEQEKPIEPSPSIKTEKLNEEAQAIKNEGILFFRKLLKAPDTIINIEHTFILKFIGVLIAVFAFITILTFIAFIPSSIGTFEISKSSLVTKFCFSIFCYVALSYGVTFMSARITASANINAKKVLSDYVFLNTFSFVTYIIELLFLIMNIYSIGAFFTMFGFAVLFSSSVYLITVYTKQSQVRIPVFFGILIYIASQIIILAIFGEVLRNMVIDFLQTQIPFLGCFLR